MNRDTFLAKITQGELDFCSQHNLNRWKEWKKNNEGKDIRIERPKKVRSLKTNSLYWVFLELIERETGNEVNAMHFFARKYLPRKLAKVKDKTGEYEFERILSTTELTQTQMSDYMAKISADCDVAIPDTRAWLEANGFIVEKPMRSDLPYPKNDLGESKL